MASSARNPNRRWPCCCGARPGETVAATGNQTEMRCPELPLHLNQLNQTSTKGFSFSIFFFVKKSTRTLLSRWPQLREVAVFVLLVPAQAKDARKTLGKTLA